MYLAAEDINKVLFDTATINGSNMSHGHDFMRSISYPNHEHDHHFSQDYFSYYTSNNNNNLDITGTNSTPTSYFQPTTAYQSLVQSAPEILPSFGSSNNSNQNNSSNNTTSMGYADDNQFMIVNNTEPSNSSSQINFSRLFTNPLSDNFTNSMEPGANGTTNENSYLLNRNDNQINPNGNLNQFTAPPINQFIKRENDEDFLFENLGSDLKKKSHLTSSTSASSSSSSSSFKLMLLPHNLMTPPLSPDSETLIYHHNHSQNPNYNKTTALAISTNNNPLFNNSEKIDSKFLLNSSKEFDSTFSSNQLEAQNSSSTYSVDSLINTSAINNKQSSAGQPEGTKLSLMKSTTGSRKVRNKKSGEQKRGKSLNGGLSSSSGVSGDYLINSSSNNTGTNKQSQKRSAHLSAEFRYRTKLNEKINRLRNLVSKQKPNISKSAVLTRSIEMIVKLQKLAIQLHGSNVQLRKLITENIESTLTTTAEIEKCKTTESKQSIENNNNTNNNNNNHSSSSSSDTDEEYLTFSNMNPTPNHQEKSLISQEIKTEDYF